MYPVSDIFVFSWQQELVHQGLLAMPISHRLRNRLEILDSRLQIVGWALPTTLVLMATRASSSRLARDANLAPLEESP